MSRMPPSGPRRRIVRGMAGFAALAATLLAMAHLTTARETAVDRPPRAAVSAAKKAPPEGGAPTRAVGARRFITAEMKS